MIATGYNGIEFGKISEEEFLDSTSSRYINFFKMFTHRDTQLRDEEWRIQGTIKVKDFTNYLNDAGAKLSNIQQISIDFGDKESFLITMIIRRVLNK